MAFDALVFELVLFIGPVLQQQQRSALNLQGRSAWRNRRNLSSGLKRRLSAQSEVFVRSEAFACQGQSRIM